MSVDSGFTHGGYRRGRSWTAEDSARLLTLRQRGLQNYEIAREMRVTEHTIKNAVQRLREAGIVIPRLPTGVPKGTVLGPREKSGPASRSKSDYETETVAMNRAVRLCEYWHRRGYRKASFWVVRTGETCRGQPLFSVKSNLVNGWPPKG